MSEGGRIAPTEPPGDFKMLATPDSLAAPMSSMSLADFGAARENLDDMPARQPEAAE